jgi:lysophospholipase L1-like esterase
VSDHLRTLRPDTAVLNFGVGGYGLGQILLRLEDRVAVLKPGDTAVIGVLTTDIDRAVLSVRDAPKPWFELGHDGGLIEHAPEGGDVASWFDAHPVQASMLLWRRLNRTWALHQAAELPSTNPSCREEDKTNLARALLSRMGEVCTEHALQCPVLVLYRPIDLEHGAGWRRTVLTEDHRLQVIDSWEWFQGGWAESYGADQHPNSQGNARIAKGVLDAIGVR